jgi:hypothetical protein
VFDERLIKLKESDSKIVFATQYLHQTPNGWQRLTAFRPVSSQGQNIDRIPATWMMTDGLPSLPQQSTMDCLLSLGTMEPKMIWARESELQRRWALLVPFERPENTRTAVCRHR